MNRNSVVIYEGPSKLADKAPIVAIATALKKPSANQATGDMVQVWIMRQDIHPAEAIREGKDATVCGDCPLRATVPGSLKGRACYVKMDGPASVWRSYKRGDIAKDTGQLAKALQKKPLRIGAYGDPAALPIRVVRDLVAKAKHGHAGYTRQWLNRSNLKLARYLMASVFSFAEENHARKLGFAPFRVRTPDQETNAATCAKQDGKAQCARCLACCGNEKSVKGRAILVHGPGARHFERLTA